ncbi:hypothetical protein OXX59_009678 [Metschnikowia pulcherrima]
MHKSALSISSNVAHGYVGNRAVVFSLQSYGWNVDAIHTTEFSNHPGYGQFKGQKTGSDTVADLFRGLRDILDLKKEYSLILVGYCPSAEVMSTIYREITPMLKTGIEKERPVLVVDPVLGDNGRLYVPQEIVEAHVSFLKLGLVDMTTPNQFELELLTGIQMSSWATVREAFVTFYEKYHVPNVVLSSVVLDGQMFGVGFSKESESIFGIPIPTIDCRFSGCGDVFTALITHAFCKNDHKLTPIILGQVLAKLGRILSISYDEEKAKIGENPVVIQDVRLIQSRNIFDETESLKYDVIYI